MNPYTDIVFEKQECNYCGDLVEPWKDKHGDLFTHICKPCAKDSAK